MSTKELIAAFAKKYGYNYNMEYCVAFSNCE